jgi:hypothetical protein
VKNLLAFLAAAVLTFLGVGWWLNWYQVRTAPGPSGHQAINIDLDGRKIGEDVQKGEKELMDAVEKARREQAAKEAALPSAPKVEKEDPKSTEPTKGGEPR